MKKIQILREDGTIDKTMPMNSFGENLLILGFTIGEIPMGLQPPFDIEYPFEAAILNNNKEKIYSVKGGYTELVELQRITQKRLP
jgi:hypothetical protein